MNYMKTSIYYILTACCILMACKKMDTTYEQYIVLGGKKYPGKAIDAKFYAGKYRAKVEWRRGDAKVVKARIFWNNFTDSVEIPIPANQQFFSHTFTNLPEDYYVYTIRTYDAQGHVSVPVEVSGGVYGDIFQSQILARPIRTALYNKDNLLNVRWEEADTARGAIATEVEYKNQAGELKLVRYKSSLPISTIADYQFGAAINYRTLYIPDSLSIDTFYTAFRPASVSIDKTEWSVKAFDNQHPGDENKATNILDGNPGTRWHGLASGSGIGYPHYMTIDMAAERTVEQVGIWRMNGDDRGPNTFRISTSMDNTIWTDHGVFNFNRSVDGEQRFTLPPSARGRYFKVTGLSGPQQYIVLGEITAYVK